MLHREFGHNMLPKLMQSRTNLGIQGYALEKQIA